MKRGVFEGRLRAEIQRVVTDDMTAERLGSGDVPVLGTPAVLAMVEEAAVAAVGDVLEDGTTTVGVWVELEHLAPSRVGAEIRTTAEVTGADGRTLEFACESHDGDRLVARARHRRVVVDRAKFLS